MTNSDTSPSVSKEETRLDEITEEMMITLIQQGANHGSFDKLPIPECRYCQEKVSALSSRIRQLIEEARNAVIVEQRDRDEEARYQRRTHDD